MRLTGAWLEELDYSKLYSAYSPVGRKSAADARVSFKVLVYGYQCGIYSSRRLEKACRYRIDFMWLLEDRKAPDHNTLSRFRTGRCRKVAEDLFYQYVKKLESHAGHYTFCWRGSVEKNLEKVKITVWEQTGLTGVEQLRQYLTAQAEQLAFVHGSGTLKSEEQRQWEKLCFLVPAFNNLPVLYPLFLCFPNTF